MSRFALFALAVVVLAAAGAEATCGKVVCPTREEWFAENCNAECDVIRIVTKAKNNEDDCCPVYKCVVNPDFPCCGTVCPASSLEEATAQCNEIFPNDPIMTNLSVEFGAQFAVLRREAKPHRGKCCDKYACRTDADILCDNTNLKVPCEDASKCPKCFDAITVASANPENGKCCPDIECRADFDCLCEDVVCPVPTCDDDLEILVQLFEANPEEGRCCPALACQQNNTAICLAERAADPDRVNPTCSDSCQVPVVTREANFERLSCFDHFECIDDPQQPCCRVNTTTDCSPEPDCQAELGACGILETRLADPFGGQCCDRFRCVQNVSCICELSICEDIADFEARTCDPRDEEAYVKKEADPENGLCCPKLRCQLTPEAKLRKLRQDLKDQRRRRRRRRQTAATTTAPTTA